MNHLESLRIEFTSSLREAMKSLTPPRIIIKRSTEYDAIKVWVDDGKNKKLLYIVTERNIEVRETFRLALDADLLNFLFEEFNNILSLKVL